VFHRIYSAPKVPDGIRFDTLMAIGSFVDLEHIAAIMLRMSLEELVFVVLQHNEEHARHSAPWCEGAARRREAPEYRLLDALACRR
jgi:hypothetical protein